MSFIATPPPRVEPDWAARQLPTRRCGAIATPAKAEAAAEEAEVEFLVSLQAMGSGTAANGHRRLYP